jgi:SAM-dependent methyltransferase
MKMEDILKDHFLIKRSFDWVICTYGLYYSENPEKTLSDLKVMVKPDGHLCIIGPARDNNKEFFDLIGSLSKIPEHILFSSNGFMDEIVIPNCEKLFNQFETYNFKNEVSYPDMDSLMDYWKSTTYFNPEIAPQFEIILKDHFEKNGRYTIKKEAIGVKCWD